MTEKIPKRDYSHEKTMLDAARALCNSWLGPRTRGLDEQEARSHEIRTFLEDVESQIIKRAEAHGESKETIDATLDRFRHCRLYYVLKGEEQPSEHERDEEGNPLPLDFNHPEIGKDVIFTFLKEKSDATKF